MSVLFTEQDVEFVKIVLNNLSGGTTTYYFGTEYFAADAVYSGSPEILPLLAESPEYRRTIDTGRPVETRNTMQVKVFSKSGISKIDLGLFDLQKNYSFQDSVLTGYYYAKPTATTTTNGATNVRQVWTITGVQFNDDDTLTLTGLIPYPKDIDLHKIAPAATFPDLAVDYQDEILAWVFGEEVIIDAPNLSTDSENTFDLFTGWHLTNHVNSDVIAVYGQSKQRNLSRRTWLTTRDSTSPLVGPTFGSSAITGTYLSLKDEWRGQRYNPAGTDFYLASATIDLKKTGTPDGVLSINCYLGEKPDGTMSTIQPTGAPLTRAVIDAADITTGAGGTRKTVDFQPPIYLPGDADYIFTVEWSNTTDAVNYFSIRADALATGSSMQQSKATRDTAWVPTTRILALGIWDYTLSSVITNVALSDYAHGYNQVIANNLLASDEPNLLNAEQQYQIKLDGLHDDGSGTYTGSAGALIHNPSDILRFLLLHASWANYGSGNVNTTQLTAVRSSLGSTITRLAFAIDKPTKLREHISECCRQSRTIAIVDRDGKFSLHYPSLPTSTTVLSQDTMQGDFELVKFQENDHNTVVNFFNCLHTPDPLQQPKSANFLRRAKTDKFSGDEVLNSTTSTAGDATRVAKMLASEALYDRREYDAGAFDKINNTTHARRLMNYYADRYSSLQSRAVVKIPRRQYYATLDQFSAIEARSFQLPNADGTTDFIRVSNDGTKIAVENERVIGHSSQEGKMTGITYEVFEKGPWMYLVPETFSYFDY